MFNIFRSSNQILKRTIINQKTSKNNSNKVNKLLKKKNFDINIKDNNGNTLLHHAVINNKLNIIIKLIENGIDVNLQNNEGNTALMLAIVDSTHQNSYIYISNIIVTELLGCKDINIYLRNNNGETALMLSIIKKNEISEKYILIHMNLLRETDNLRHINISLDNFSQFIIRCIQSLNTTNENYKNIEDSLYYMIIIYFKQKYNLNKLYKKSINKYILFETNRRNQLFYFFIRVHLEPKIYNNFTYIKYIGVNEIGINADGLTRDFFFNCEKQLHELLLNYPDDPKNKKNTGKNRNINERILNQYLSMPNNINNISDIKKLYDIDFFKKKLIFIIKLLISSKKNNCPIFLNIGNNNGEKTFIQIFKELYDLIFYYIFLNIFGLETIQKNFIRNILINYENILNKNPTFSIFNLLLSSININKVTSYNKSNIKKILNNKKTKNYELNNINIKKEKNEYLKKYNNNKYINEINLIEESISNGIYIDYIDFYYCHFIPNIVSFKTFMSNIFFESKGMSDFRDDIIKLLNYIGEKDNNNILLLAQAMSGNTKLYPEYKITMYPKLFNNKAKHKPVLFHTCFINLVFFEDNFPFLIIDGDEKHNNEVLDIFMTLIKNQLQFASFAR